MRLNEVMRVEALIQWEQCPCKKRKRHQGQVHKEKDPGRMQRKKMAICKPRREALRETKPVDILNF